MQIIHVEKSQLEAVTMFLIQKEVIFHPTVSPNGCPDFTGRSERKYLLIIDRNIMTKLVELCRTGELKDAIIRRVLGALMFWAEINDVAITGGLALNEYAIAKGDSSPSSIENSIFLEIFKQYSVQTWLDIFEEKVLRISPVKLTNCKTYDFLFESEHYLAHLSEVICLYRLYLTPNIEPHKQVIEFLSWVNENLLFCAYTTTYACMLFSNKIKQPKVSTKDTFESNLEKCSNQACDLTYLSIWSTLYWKETDTDINYLFATMDTDLKKIFKHTHDTSTNIFLRFFGEIKGSEIQMRYDSIISNRQRPNMSISKINEVLAREKKKLAAISNLP